MIPMYISDQLYLLCNLDTYNIIFLSITCVHLSFWNSGLPRTFIGQSYSLTPQHLALSALMFGASSCPPGDTS